MRQIRIWLCALAALTLLCGSGIAGHVGTATIASAASDSSPNVICALVTGCPNETANPGVPTWSVVAYGYFCANGAADCTEASGQLRYLGVETYGYENQRHGKVNPVGYFVECGKFFADQYSNIHYYHQFIWSIDQSSPRPQPNMAGGVSADAVDDSLFPQPTDAYGWVSGAAYDPISRDTGSVTGVQGTNNSAHTPNQLGWRVVLKGPIYESYPTSHHGPQVGTGSLSCYTHNDVHMHVDESFHGYDPQSTTEASFEGYEPAGELNYPP